MTTVLERPAVLRPIPDPVTVLAILEEASASGQGPAVRAVRSRCGLRTHRETVAVIRGAVTDPDLADSTVAAHWRRLLAIADRIQGHVPAGDPWEEADRVDGWVDGYWRSRGDAS